MLKISALREEVIYNKKAASEQSLKIGMDLASMPIEFQLQLSFPFRWKWLKRLIDIFSTSK